MTRSTRSAAILTVLLVVLGLLAACVAPAAPAPTQAPAARLQPPPSRPPQPKRPPRRKPRPQPRPLPRRARRHAGPAATEAPAAPAAAAGPLDELVKAAKAEGKLTTIALPHDWCNYGEVIDGFKAKYGLKVNELNPDAGSGDEIEAIKANKDNTGPQAPDVIDVGLAFGPQVTTRSSSSPTRSRPGTRIPADAKDADGYWYGDYYGVLAFEVNNDVVKNVPQDWADLLKPEYKGQVALAGDPRAPTRRR